MTTWQQLVLVLAGTAAILALLLVLRRVMPPDGFYSSVGHAGAIVGVLGTAFAVLLAFTNFLVFQKHNAAEAAASSEALAVSDLARTADLIGPPARDALRGELVCYARAVAVDEWRTMTRGERSPLADGWIARFQETIDTLDVSAGKQSIALTEWIDQASERRAGRRERLAGATTRLPSEVWAVLLLGGAVVLVQLLGFADRRERFLAQAVLIGGTAAVVFGALLMIRFLDRPYGDHGSAVRPTAMTASAEQLARENRTAPPCDERGDPR